MVANPTLWRSCSGKRRPAPKGAALKAFEDKLDAIVCAWVGICVIEHRATPFGDHDSAIWVPTAHSHRPRDPLLGVVAT